MKTVNYQVEAQALPTFFDALLIDRLNGKVIGKADQFYIVEVFYSAEQERLIGKLKLNHGRQGTPPSLKHIMYYIGGALIGQYLEDGFKKILGEQNKHINSK